MSYTNPFKDFVTLSGEISHTLHTLENLLKQHANVHGKENISYYYLINKVATEWDKLPYPQTVAKNNDSFV